ncbi:MAG: DUF11 domain-containing protein, partial [Methanobrevibacter sp.]|nr:DUF11 domain-containing protein [Methanobrevibacter sp.]
MILCVFLTFSTVSATDLDESSFNSVVFNSQSESSFTNLNEEISDNIVKSDEDKDCVESMNELSNLNDDLKFSLSSINSDENSLKSILSPSENTFSSIQNSINNAESGDTIDLNGKTYTGNGSTILVNKSVIISGGSGTLRATLDANNLSGIFKITAPNVKLINCNFINSNDKAVYYLDGNGTISNCNFNYNYASKFCAHVYVTPNCTDFLLENSNFYNGFSYKYSNVAITANNATVRNCTFINNTVKNNVSLQACGGALQVGYSEIAINEGSVENCLFINNSAISDNETTHAGAFCFRPGIKVSNSTFINNYCNRIGGATTLHSDGDLFNCIFINNSAGIYGGAISTGFEVNDITVNINSCTFENNTAPMGGAIQIKGNNVKVFNSLFNENNASSTDGGALFIMGNEAIIINSTFYKNFAENVGAGVLINGTEVSILNSSFNYNIAGFGAAVYVVGSNANLFSSNFTNHSVINGSVYINGSNTYIYDSNFIDNQGENGAAIYIYGSDSNLIFNNFSLNNVSKKGGAIYIEGSNANIISSDFSNNSAIPDESDISRGLGGAIYIKGDNNTVDSSDFTFNTARNGSAIYTDGSKMTLSNTNFDKNQAWSYLLDSLVNPAISYFNESDILINFTLIGGNNIANAIYNTASIDEIYFYNVSYISSKGQKLTGNDEIHPVDGAENSNNGSLLYQDDREDNQWVNVIVYRASSSNEETKSTSSLNMLDNESFNNNENILNKTFTTGILGDIDFNLSDYVENPLKTGKYHVYAEHFEDDYYKEIDETNEFDIIPILDVAIDIGSSRVNLDFNKTVKFTVKVKNNGPNNATEVNVNAIIPEGLIYLSSSPSIGIYNPDNGTWIIGNLDCGENQTLVITVQTNKTGLIDYPVNVSSYEDDYNMTNNYDNKTIRVIMADLAITVNASEDVVRYGDIVNWTINVKNNGPNNASNLHVLLNYVDGELIYLDSSNSSFNQSANKWEIPNLLVGDEITLEISTKVSSSGESLKLNTTVSSDTFDPIESNNFDFDSVDVMPLCDLITKVSVSESPVNKDDVVEWIVVVSNDGPNDASNVSVSLSDWESLGLIVLNCSDHSFDLDSSEWIIGNLDNGGSVSLIITTKANKSNDNITVFADVETITYELNKENNHDNESLEILPICDIAVSIMPDNDIVYIDGTVNWIINVTNNGPDKASQVNAYSNIPENLEFIFYDLTKGELENIADENGNIVDLIWKIGDLENNESALLAISTKALEEGTVINNVTANSSTPDINQSNNLDSASIEVIPLNGSTNDNSDNPNETDDYGDYYDEFPWEDYFLEDNNVNDDNVERNLHTKSKSNPKENPKMSIDISKKKTGNPFILFVFSLFS